nr:polyadenylate-binding protein 2-like [Ipomoea batatas]
MEAIRRKIGEAKTIFLRLQRIGQVEHTTTTSTTDQAAVEMDSFYELSQVVSPTVMAPPSLSSSRRLPSAGEETRRPPPAGIRREQHGNESCRRFSPMAANLRTPYPAPFFYTPYGYGKVPRFRAPTRYSPYF